MTLADHPFVAHHPDSTASPNSCVRCPLTLDYHPVGPHIARDIEDERKIKTYAASLVPHFADPENPFIHHIIKHTESRALEGPVRDAETRDYFTEIVEELSDGVNYFVWWVQEIDRRADGQDHGEERMAVLAAMVKLYEAWEAVQIAGAAARR